MASVVNFSSAERPAKSGIPAGSKPVPFNGGGFAPRSIPAVSWTGFAIFLTIWQVTSMLGWVSPTFVPSPIVVLKALWSLTASGELWVHVSVSLVRIGTGWAIGTLLGLCVGIGAGLFSIARSLATPTISALYPIPKIALLPLIILWLGIGDTARILVITAGVFFPTAIATYTAIDGVPRNIIRMAQSFNVPLRSIIWKAVLPGAMPDIIGGMRISITSALLTMVAAEMIGASTGLGAFVLLQGNLMRSDTLLAGVLVISLLGFFASSLLSLAERILFKWR